MTYPGDLEDGSDRRFSTVWEEEAGADPVPDDPAPPAPARRRPVRLLLGAAAFAALGAILWYAYSAGQRAGNGGPPPLIAADPSPAKVRPEQAGGMEIPHRDKLVYDRLAPDPEPPRVERLLPPPEEPLPRPQPDLPHNLVVADPPAAPPPATVPAPSMAAVTEEQPAPAPAPAPDSAPVPPVAQGEAAPEEPPAPTDLTAFIEERGLNPLPAPSPAVRPAPPTQPGGGYRVQIASVPSEALARQEWTRLAARHADLLGGLTAVFVAADLGARGVYYRVQAGPVDQGRAQAICARLKAQKVGCIVVRE